MSKFIPTLILVAGLVVLCGCAPTGDKAGSDTIRIVTTTGMIADAAGRIVGDHGTVEALMGPGVDPHLFKASESDVRRLAEADLILYNGLHLEGKMGDILVKLARTRAVVPVSEAIPDTELREPPEFLGMYDPHIWFDLELWSRTLDPIADALAKLLPKHADLFRGNAAAFRDEVNLLDRWIQEQVEQIPAQQRILITAHDAFGYFGRRYGIRVVGLQGLSTLAEAGLKDVERVVDVVVDNRIKSIFVESSVPRRSIEAVQAACRSRGHDVSIGGQLFSDAMGTVGTPEGTYPGMVRANVETIVNGLK